MRKPMQARAVNRTNRMAHLEADANVDPAFFSSIPWGTLGSLAKKGIHGLDTVLNG